MNHGDERGDERCHDAFSAMPVHKQRGGSVDENSAPRSAVTRAQA